MDSKNASLDAEYSIKEYSSHQFGLKERSFPEKLLEGKGMPLGRTGEKAGPGLVQRRVVPGYHMTWKVMKRMVS